VLLYYMRKRLREVYRRRNRHVYLSQKDIETLVAPALGVLDTVSQSELHEILRWAVEKLKPREQKAITLWMEGMSNRAIANELKTTVGAVKMLEFRTILKLRRMLHDRICEAEFGRSQRSEEQCVKQTVKSWNY
jgi:RNA polymerase sigma factor (sigma-70 family)